MVRLALARSPFLFLTFLVGCSTTQEVRRLNPVPVNNKAPAECRLVSVAPLSPAEKIGLKVGDKLVSLNGKSPADAWDAGELVNASGDVMKVDVARVDGSSQTLDIPLTKTKPRLGAACDLTGFRKHGVTAAGNESQTVFDGPYALTASGIIDEGL